MSGQGCNGRDPIPGYHLDATFSQHLDVRMRTTLTVDPDVERLLKQAMHGEKQGLKETLNAALRRGLAHQSPQVPAKPFLVEAKPMGLRAGLDPARLQELADEVEVEAFTATTRRLRRASR